MTEMQLIVMELGMIIGLLFVWFFIWMVRVGGSR